jgi:hypothetical protein
MSALICEPMLAKPCRVVGTTASTTPRVKTAKPAAKAGRSIASRQSPRWPGRAAARSGNKRRIQAVSGATQLVTKAIAR